MQISVAVLREIKFFECFTDQELGQILGLGKVISFDAFSNIVIEGELSWGLYLILTGKVGISKTDKMSGNSYDVCYLHENNFFGEMSLFDDGPRAATCRALTPSQCLFVPKEEFTRFVFSDSSRKLRFMESVVRNLVGRLRELDDSYVISQYQLWKTALQSKREVA